jgi:hypothetical protein
MAAGMGMGASGVMANSGTCALCEYDAVNSGCFGGVVAAGCCCIVLLGYTKEEEGKEEEEAGGVAGVGEGGTRRCWPGVAAVVGAALKCAPLLLLPLVLRVRLRAAVRDPAAAAAGEVSPAPVHKYTSRDTAATIGIQEHAVVQIIVRSTCGMRMDDMTSCQCRSIAQLGNRK